MYFIELFDKIFCFDSSLGITFVYENNKWKISEISIHEIERMDLINCKQLTNEEANFIVDTSGLKTLQMKIKKIYEEL